MTTLATRAFSLYYSVSAAHKRCTRHIKRQRKLRKSFSKHATPYKRSHREMSKHHRPSAPERALDTLQSRAPFAPPRVSIHQQTPPISTATLMSQKCSHWHPPSRGPASPDRRAGVSRPSTALRSIPRLAPTARPHIQPEYVSCILNLIEPTPGRTQALLGPPPWCTWAVAGGEITYTAGRAVHCAPSNSTRFKKQV